MVRVLVVFPPDELDGMVEIKMVDDDFDDDDSGWVDCWNGCNDGYFDGYEEDPLWYDPGDMEPCHVCKGEGGWLRKVIETVEPTTEL